jgi:hypothetical protein
VTGTSRPPRLCRSQTSGIGPSPNPALVRKKFICGAWLFSSSSVEVALGPHVDARRLNVHNTHLTPTVFLHRIRSGGCPGTMDILTRRRADIRESYPIQPICLYQIMCVPVKKNVAQYAEFPRKTRTWPFFGRLRAFSTRIRRTSSGDYVRAIVFRCSS